MELDLTSVADEWEYRHVKVSSTPLSWAAHISETDSACPWAETAETAVDGVLVLMTTTTITPVLCEL